MKPGKLKTVRWRDHASASEWQTLEEIKKWVSEIKTKPCVTKGYVVYEDKDVIVLSSENDGEGNIGTATAIFKNLIVKK